MFTPLIAQIDLQGHRGARGLAPENTIPAFLIALDFGVTTVELDVVITKDKKVLVSHDHYFSSVFCLDSDGNDFKKADEEKYNIYQMNYNAIKDFDCGSKLHKDYPEQNNERLVKPLLSDVIKAIENHVKGQTKYLVKYNVEIKSSESGDNINHPEIPEFSKLVYDVLNTYLDMNRVNIQSFDFRVLQYWHENYPAMRLAMLIGNNKGIDSNLELLGFTPEIYSSYFQSINESKVTRLHDMGMQVIPWTVNKKGDMQKLVSMNVDGIITDYPNRARELGYTVEIPYGREDDK